MLKNKRAIFIGWLLIAPVITQANNEVKTEEVKPIAPRTGLGAMSILSPTKEGLKDLAVAAALYPVFFQGGIIAHEGAHAAVFAAGFSRAGVESIRLTPHIERGPNGKITGISFGYVKLNADMFKQAAARAPGSTVGKMLAGLAAGPAGGLAAAYALKRLSQHEEYPESLREPTRLGAALLAAAHTSQLVPKPGGDGGQIARILTLGRFGGIQSLPVRVGVGLLIQSYYINGEFPEFFGEIKSKIKSK